MKLTLRKSVLLIIAGIAVAAIASLPMLISKNDSFLMLGAIISSLMFLVAIVNIIRVLISK